MIRITSNYRPVRQVNCVDLRNDPSFTDEYLDHVENCPENKYGDWGCSVIRAYGEWHLVSEFESIHRGISVPVAAPTPRDKGKLDDWEAILGMSHFSALVMRFTPNFEGIQVGYVTW